MKTHEVWLRPEQDGKAKIVLGDFEVFTDTMGRPVFIIGREWLYYLTDGSKEPSDRVSVFPMEAVTRWIDAKDEMGAPGGYGQTVGYREKYSLVDGPIVEPGESEAMCLIEWFKRRHPWEYDREPRWARNMNRLEAIIRHLMCVMGGPEHMARQERSS